MKKPNIQLLVDGPLAEDPGVGQCRKGVIYAANDNRFLGESPVSDLTRAVNDSRFVAAQYDIALTAFSVGWQDPTDTQGLLNSLYPTVEVPMRFSFKSADNGEAYLSETDDVRAIGSAFKRVEFSGTEVQSRCYNKGLTVRLDYDEYAADGNWEQRFTGWLQGRLARNELRRGNAILDSAAGAAVAKTWGITQNPDGDIRSTLRLAKGDGGLRPNVVAMGGAAWDMRINCYEGNVTNASYANIAQKTPEDIRMKLMLDKLVISESVYTTAAGAAAAKTEIIGQTLYLYYAKPGLMKDDPSNMKRFVFPTGSGLTRVYVQTFHKYREVSVEHYSNIVATSTLGVRKMTIS